MTVPYVYYLRWNNPGLHYIGCRHAKGCHPDDLWVKYKTHSKYVRHCMLYDPDVIRVVRVCESVAEARYHESRLLKLFGAAKSDSWLNMSNGDKEFYRPGISNAYHNSTDRKTYMKLWKKEKEEDIKQYQKGYRKDNRQKLIKEAKEYKKRPEYKEQQRKYDQRPERKKYQNERVKRWARKHKEYLDEYRKEYHQRPEVKSRRKEYNQKSEVKARNRALDIKRDQLPERKAQKSLNNKKRILRNKRAKLDNLTERLLKCSSSVRMLAPT